MNDTCAIARMGSTGRMRIMVIARGVDNDIRWLILGANESKTQDAMFDSLRGVNVVCAPVAPLGRYSRPPRCEWGCYITDRISKAIKIECFLVF